MKKIPIPSWLKVATISCETCRHSLALRSNSGPRTGIKMRELWYCSARCFREAAELEVARLLKLKVEQTANGSRMPLGLSLIRRDLLTVGQWRKATEEQKEKGGELGEILVRQGAVSEKQVTAIRAAVWGCPVFPVSGPANQVPVNIPITLMQKYCMVPVHYVAATNLLLVGFVHGIEYELLYAIEQMTGCTTKPCFVTPSDFLLQMQAQNVDTPGSEVKFEAVQTPAEIARILCTSGIEMEADEAFVERCKDYLWARLKGVPRDVDLLFKAG